MNDVVNKLLEEARDWKELTLAERQGSEAAFQFGRREVGHLHRGTLHVSFPGMFGMS